MTTLLQSLGFFSDLFNFFLPFLLVFAVLYAVLVKSRFLTDDANINALISFAVALIVVLSGAGKFIMALTPFMGTLFVIIFLMLMIFMFFGLKLEDVLQSKLVISLIVVVSLIFIFYVLGQIAGPAAYQMRTGTESIGSGNNTTVTVSASPSLLSASEKNCDFSSISTNMAVVCIISNPKFLGAITILGLLAIATFFIAYNPD
jgi:asparagine N-glycosylation enzyme membrane subunit Stt3